MIERLAKMGLAETVSKWLEGDATNSFFEFKLAPWDSGTSSSAATSSGSERPDPMKGNKNHVPTMHDRPLTLP